MSELARTAYRAFLNQRQRCSNPKNPLYKRYGARGIRVEYGPREFIGWWLHEYAKNPVKGAVVGRIDHDKNYKFGNIRMETKASNTRERNERIKNQGEHFKKPVACFDAKTGEFLFILPSLTEAAKLAGKSLSAISHVCRRPKKHGLPKYTFRYAE